MSQQIILISHCTCDVTCSLVLAQRGTVMWQWNTVMAQQSCEVTVYHCDLTVEHHEVNWNTDGTVEQSDATVEHPGVTMELWCHNRALYWHRQRWCHQAALVCHHRKPWWRTDVTCSIVRVQRRTVRSLYCIVAPLWSYDFKMQHCLGTVGHSHRSTGSWGATRQHCLVQ